MKHDARTITASDGIPLRLEQWEPEGPVRFAVMLVHGGGDHVGRFGTVVETLGALGGFVFGIDLRGQGASGGPRGHVDRFEDYANDLRHTLLEVAATRPEAQQPSRMPWFVYGHSVGGLATLLYLLDRASDVPLRGVILSAPLLGLAMEVPGYKKQIARIAVKLLPKLALPSGIPPTWISHDPTAVAAYVADERRVTVSSAGWYFAMIRAIERVKTEIGRIRVPLLWLAPGEDGVADPRAHAPMFARLTEPQRDDQTLVDLPGCFHEAHNELPNLRDKAMQIVRDWVAERVERSSDAIG